MSLAAEQQQAIVEWAEQTEGIVEVWLCGPHARDDAQTMGAIELALTIRAIGIGDPLTLYFFERERWEAQLIERLRRPTVVLWYDLNGAPRAYAFCQEASVLVFLRKCLTNSARSSSTLGARLRPSILIRRRHREPARGPPRRAAQRVRERTCVADRQILARAEGDPQHSALLPQDRRNVTWGNLWKPTGRLQWTLRRS